MLNILENGIAAVTCSFLSLLVFHSIHLGFVHHLTALEAMFAIDSSCPSAVNAQLG